MTSYKYPYVPKEYYPAVMFACKMIRENGYFNQAIEKSARYYSVDPDELEKHVRARQGAGQSAKSKKNPVKYHWYAIQYTGDTWMKSSIELVKATSKSNAQSRIHKEQDYYGPSDYTSCVIRVERIEEFDNENDAKERCRQWYKEVQQ